MDSNRKGRGTGGTLGSKTLDTESYVLHVEISLIPKVKEMQSGYCVGSTLEINEHCCRTLPSRRASTDAYSTTAMGPWALHSHSYRAIDSYIISSRPNILRSEFFNQKNLFRL